MHSWYVKIAAAVEIDEGAPPHGVKNEDITLSLLKFVKTTL